jgi:hypothetical protein
MLLLPANPQGQGQKCNQGKAWFSRQITHTKTKVLKHALDSPFPAGQPERMGEGAQVSDYEIQPAPDIDLL